MTKPAKMNCLTNANVPLSVILDYVAYIIDKKDALKEIKKLFHILENGKHRHFGTHKEYYRLYGCFDSEEKNFPQDWYVIIEKYSKNYINDCGLNYNWSILFQYGKYIIFDIFRKNITHVKSKESCECILKIALDRDYIDWQEIGYCEFDNIGIEIDVYYD